MPEFCLVEITNKEIFAGGKLSDDSFETIKNDLKRFNYGSLYLN